MSIINNIVLEIMAKAGYQSVPSAGRYFAAKVEDALALLV
jgi:hypothetical protein